MANRLYDKGREKFLRGEVSWNADTIKAVLVDLADYTPNFTTDEFLADVPLAARVSTSLALTGKTTANGVAGADNTQFSTVAGDQSEALVLIKDTGSVATSPLIGYIDTATGLPITPNGGNAPVTWDVGANKIFKL